MINLVRLSLRRPYTMAVAAMLIMLMGAISVTRMMVDIFPTIDIPVVYVAWSYNGLNAEDMERRVVLVAERAYSTTVNGIERIESLSIPGQGILKIYFQQGADIGAAIAQISAQSNAVLRIAPPGMQPPNIIQFNASNVPVVQVTLNSRTLPEQMLSDYANQFLRLRLFTIPGLSIPAAFGGKQRQIIVEVDTAKASSKGLSQMDVVNAMGTTNVIVPAGIARLGPNEYNIQLNSSPRVVEQFNDLPVGVRDGSPVLLGDIAKVSDSFAQQTNIVRINGQRASFLPILKNCTASTLAVVDAVKNMLPDIQAIAPEGMELEMDFDQSVFVRSAVENVVKEAMLASILVSLMILVFLGSWRNTVVVAISIPLSIFAGIVGLFLTGQTINLMTLGGLALAIGMLVDNATVVMENIHRNQTLGKPLTVAILDGSVEVIQPLTVATLVHLHRVLPGRVPGRARRASCSSRSPSPSCWRCSRPTSCRSRWCRRSRASCSRTSIITPTDETARLGPPAGRRVRPRLRPLPRRLWALLAGVLVRKRFVLGCFRLFFAPTAALVPVVGTDFFPAADVGILKLHVRAPEGYRLEGTEGIMIEVEDRIREIIPPAELRTVNHTIGVPGALNLAFVPSDNVSGADGEMLISLNKPHRPSEYYRSQLRERLEHDFPGVTFYFQTADIVSQVLNFGLPAPIDIQIQDQNFAPLLRSRPAAAADGPAHPGRGRSAHHANSRLPDASDRRRPAARGAARRRATRRREQHARVAVGQLADQPDLLSSIRRTA